MNGWGIEMVGASGGWGLFVGVACVTPSSSLFPPLQLNVMQDKQKTEMLQFVSGGSWVGAEGGILGCNEAVLGGS